MTQKQLSPQSRGPQNKPSDFRCAGEYGTSEDTPPDWGGEEEDSSPDGQDKEQAAGAQWPWGPADQDAEQQRPNEPAGSRRANPPARRLTGPTSRRGSHLCDHQGRPARQKGNLRPRRGGQKSPWCQTYAGKCRESKSTWHGRGGAPHGHVLRLSERSKKVSPVTS